MATLASTDLVNAVNAAGGNGFASAQQLTDGMAVVLAFAVALEAAATAQNTTVAALAQSFANRASISVQMQAIQAALSQLATTQQTQNASIETQRQTLQGQLNALTTQLANA